MKFSNFLIFTSIICFSFLSTTEGRTQGTQVKTLQQTDVKLLAFKVLQTKCNSCHKWRNPNKVFTLDNMDGLSPSIHKQVFVFKRMPKGRKRKQKMTEEEFQILKNWISKNQKQFQ